MPKIGQAGVQRPIRKQQEEGYVVSKHITITPHTLRAMLTDALRNGVVLSYNPSADRFEAAFKNVVVIGSDPANCVIQAKVLNYGKN